MPCFHSHDDDFLYEFQRRDRKQPARRRLVVDLGGLLGVTRIGAQRKEQGSESFDCPGISQ